MSLHQFVEKLKAVVNLPIWRVIHPADGWLFLDIGQQYQDFILDKEGCEKPYVKGECQLNVKGNWTITHGGDIVESRMLKPDETQRDYFTRMEYVADNFPLTSISTVTHEDNCIVFGSVDDYQLRVIDSGKNDSLGLAVVSLNSSSQPVIYTHTRYDTELQSLVNFSSEVHCI